MYSNISNSTNRIATSNYTVQPNSLKLSDSSSQPAEIENMAILENKIINQLHLLELPLEIILNILENLSAKQIVSFMLLNKAASIIGQNFLLDIFFKGLFNGKEELLRFLFLYEIEYKTQRTEAMVIFYNAIMDQRVLPCRALKVLEILHKGERRVEDLFGASLIKEDEIEITNFYRENLISDQDIIFLLLFKNKNTIPDAFLSRMSYVEFKEYFNTLKNDEKIKIIKNTWLTQMPDKYWESTITKAIEENNVTFLKIFIENNKLSNFDYKDSKGTPFFNLAAIHKDISIAELLLENHINPNMTDADENTPLHVAASRAMQNMISLLLKEETGFKKINHVNRKKQTALHMALAFKQTVAAHHLLNYNAKANLSDAFKKRPLDYAKYHLRKTFNPGEKNSFIEIINRLENSQ